MNLNIAERWLALAERLRDPRAAWWVGLWAAVLLAHLLIYASGFYALWPVPDEGQIVGYFLGFGLPMASSALLLLFAWLKIRRGAELAQVAERLIAVHLSLAAVLILLGQGSTFIMTEQQAALLSQQPALSVAWLSLSYGLLLALSQTNLGRRGLALALSGGLSLALLALLALPIMQRAGRIELGQGETGAAWFEWQADSQGCTDYRFSGQGLGGLWLGDEGLAGVNPVNEGQTCAAAPLLLRVIDAQGSEKSFLVGNTAARASLAGWWEALLAGLFAPWLMLYGGALRRRYGPVLEDALAGQRQQRAALALLLLGLSIFYGLRLAYLDNLMSVRSQPPETDDSYAYIWMSFKLGNCANCASLERLRQDIHAPTDDDNLSRIRWRRTYLDSLYAPLQSALLALPRPFSPSWEAAYSAYMVGGALLEGLALGLFLHSLIGPGPAGLALILLALLPWSVRVPPSTLALFIALIAWRLAWRPRLPTWAFFLLIGLLLLSHTIGRLYALVFIALVGLNSLASSGRLPLLKLVGGAALVGLYWALAALVGIDSQLVLPSASPPYQVTALAQLHHLAGRILSFAQASLGLVGLGLGVLALALALLPDVLRRRWLIFALVFGPLLLASAFYVTDFLHDIANRLLVVYRYLPTALLAFLAWGGLVLALRRRTLLAAALASGLIVLSLAQHTRIYSDSLAADTYAKTFQNYAFRTEGLQALLDQAEAGAPILYNLPPNYDALLTWSLVNGAHQHPAIFLPMLDAQQRQADEVRQACWMVAYTPGALGRQNGILQMRYEDGLRATLDTAQDMASLSLLIPDSPRPYRLILRVDDGDEYTQDVPAHSPGWRGFSVPAGLQAQAFTLHRQGGTEADGIMGLRFGAGPQHWAWDAGLQLDFGYISFDGRREEQAVFRLEALLPPGWQGGVILDDSSDVLAVQRAGC